MVLAAGLAVTFVITGNRHYRGLRSRHWRTCRRPTLDFGLSDLGGSLMTLYEQATPST